MYATPIVVRRQPQQLGGIFDVISSVASAAGKVIGAVGGVTGAGAVPQNLAALAGAPGPTVIQGWAQLGYWQYVQQVASTRIGPDSQNYTNTHQYSTSEQQLAQNLLASQGVGTTVTTGATAPAITQGTAANIANAIAVVTARVAQSNSQGNPLTWAQAVQSAIATGQIDPVTGAAIARYTGQVSAATGAVAGGAAVGNITAFLKANPLILAGGVGVLAILMLRRK